MAHEDERPILVCRVECPQQNLDSLDEWMPKHFDDSLAHEAVTSAANYGIVRDYSTLPAAFNGHGNRFIVYVVDDIPGLMRWIDSPQIREAIEDGQDREGAYPPLDDEPFTGNIYELMELRNPAGRDFVGAGPIVAERFEVPARATAEFDVWLNGDHLAAIETWPGVTRTRTWRQKREDVPRRFPYERYMSKGNRMVWAEFEEGTDVRRLLADTGVVDTIADSIRWDLRLPYVRREASEHILTRYPEDAFSEAIA